MTNNFSLILSIMKSRKELYVIELPCVKTENDLQKSKGSSKINECSASLPFIIINFIV